MGAGMDSQGPDVSSPQVQYPLVDTQPQLCLKVSGPDHNLPRALPGLAEGSEEPDKGPTALGPTRLLYPWNSPDKNTGVGCHSLLQGIFLTQGSNLGLFYIAGRFFTTEPLGKLQC